LGFFSDGPETLPEKIAEESDVESDVTAIPDKFFVLYFFPT